MAAVNASLVDGVSGLIAMGLDKGDGVVRRLLASEDPRGGMLISWGSCLIAEVACNAGPVEDALALAASRFDYDKKSSVTEF